MLRGDCGCRISWFAEEQVRGSIPQEWLRSDRVQWYSYFLLL